MFSLFRFGLKPSIDFTGGTLLEITAISGIKKEMLEKTAEKISLPVANIQQSQGGTYILRIKPEGSEKTQMFLNALEKDSNIQAQLLRNETVGPVLGRELLQKALIAAVFAIICILLYIAYAFKNVTYGIAAIVALTHDLLVVLGGFSILGIIKGVEIDTLFVTAILTTMSFSVHDTIVVFDRIREMKKRGFRGTVEEITDAALTQTMSRSLANSVTIIIMLLALVLLGGETIRWFAVALLVGTISGTYSSPFVAVPVFLFLRRFIKE
jgi:preprotein translocase subunit SecF